MSSACRWMIFQPPRSKGNIIVSRRTCGRTAVWPVYSTSARSMTTVYAIVSCTYLTKFTVATSAPLGRNTRGEEVAVVDLLDACLAQATEPAEDRRPLVLRDHRQPQRRISVEEGRVGGLVALQEAVEVAPMAGAIGAIEGV